MESDTPSEDSTPSNQISTPVPSVSKAIQPAEWKAIFDHLLKNVEQVENAAHRAGESWPARKYPQNRTIYTKIPLAQFAHIYRNALALISTAVDSSEEGKPVPLLQQRLTAINKMFSDNACLDHIREEALQPPEQSGLTADQQKQTLEAINNIETLTADFCSRIKVMKEQRMRKNQNAKQ